MTLPGRVLLLAILGCRPPAAVAPPPTLGPCSDAHACAVGCGEGRDEDCRAFVATLRDGDRDLGRAVGETGCVAGSAVGCSLAGRLWLEVHPGEDRTDADRTAAGWLERGCTKLDPGACARFATLLVDGRGRPKDPGHAEALFVWSCDRGEAIGCFGAGARADEANRPADAVRLFGLACDRGYALACARLGDLLDEGRGCVANEVWARSAYQKACDGGELAGCMGRDGIDDRVHPIERVTVRVFEIRAGATPDPEALAQRAVDQLARGETLDRVAGAYGTPTGDGRRWREQTLTRGRTATPLQDAAFALTPGAATVVSVPSFGCLVVVRP